MNLGQIHTSYVRADRPWDVEEVADYLHLSTRYVYQLAREGKLPAVRAGRRWLFNPQRVMAFAGME